MNLYGIVVAAGRGERFGVPKAGLVVQGLSLWQWAVAALEAAGAAGVIVVGEVPGGIPGGARRRDSVAAGMAALPPDATHVLIHDAARPLATPALATAVIVRLAVGDVDGVVPALPLGDTIKRVEGERVVETIQRTGLVAVQTPQGFRLEALRAAHAADADDATDDAQLVERHGGSVVYVPGESTNLKITYPEDLALAEALAP
ncbi:MAG TPA: 2-C-methyl-D-erythritol 4-phosphate cytidylyltransferase [Actinobacteria bacterium]|nr:2-C-methyl-D-erythritol 4-phosphate cytidylyltransferase [Actinomycetota bacterium]